MTTYEKTDNARGAHGAKLELRRNVLQAVRPSSVFDAFCGTGEMWRGAWSKADRYIGCDERAWSTDDEVPRFVADNRLVLRSIDLRQFNVFDFDAYGSPWEQLLILAARRRWMRGELGGVVITDGSSMKVRYGGLPYAMAELIGRDARTPSGMGTADTAERFAIKAWCSRSKVKPLQQWQASGRGSGRGGQRMTYTAIVFQGL